MTEYLAKSACAINSITEGSWGRGDDSARKVYQALGFSKSGSRDLFGSAALDERKVEAALRVDQLRSEKRLRRGEGGVTGAIGIVADEMRKSPSTVRDWYYELKPILAMYPSDNIFKTDPPK